MTKLNYAQEIASNLDAEVRKVEKANGVFWIGITKQSGGISPIVYIDDYFINGIEVDEATEKIRNALENANLDINVKDFTNFDTIKPYLRLRLYNENSTHVEIIYSAIEWGFKDLILTPYIEGFAKTPEGIGSVKVTEKLLEAWGVNTYDVFNHAIENTKADVRIESMGDMLSSLGIGDFAGQPSSSEMFVVTNKSGTYGAAAILGATEKLKAIFPEGYIVLPSSVHEVICVSKNMGDGLANIVKSVNADVVDETDILSDNVYYF